MKIKRMMVALLIVCSLGLCSCKLSTEYYVFADIEECRRLRNVVTEYVEIDVKTDENLGDLKYIDYVAASCKAEDCQFKIYAYVFDSETTAKSYFKSVSTREATKDSSYFWSSGMFSYKLVVLDGSKAYTVYSTLVDKNQTEQLLSTVFSVSV